MRPLLLPLLGLFAAGCASDRYLASSGHKDFAQHNYAKAAEDFGKDAKDPGQNQLLFMLDEGSALFANHQFKEAIDVFLRAEKLAEIKDYTSISEEVGTLVTSDNVRGYKGEDFEKVLINVYLAMGYASLGMFEDAQVESRKINLILYRMINEGKRHYQESPFARYLSGLMWEATHNVNDAYIDYKYTYGLNPNFPKLGSDLIATSHKMRFFDEEADWKKKFPGQSARVIPPGDGELIVIFERGQSPIKIPRDGRDSNLPRFIRRFSEESGAQILVNNEVKGQVESVLNIEDLSIRYLEDRISRMAAAKLGGLAVKGAVAIGVGKLSNNSDLGVLAFMALAATDRADLRSWKSLPADLEMLRLPLKAGSYKVDLQVLGLSGNHLRDIVFEKVDIKAGKKVFVVGR